MNDRKNRGPIEITPDADHRPRSLVWLYGVSGNTTSKRLLGLLLDDAETWRVMAQHVQALNLPPMSPQASQDPYRLLWAEIEQIRRLAYKTKKKPGEVREDLKDITAAVTTLRRLIIDPSREDEDKPVQYRRPRSAPDKTGARFDRMVFEHFPASVMNINVSRMQSIKNPRDWAGASVPERNAMAYGMLTEWPTLSEVLDQLAANVETARAAEQTALHAVRRDRKTKNGDSSTRERFFVIELVRYLCPVFQMQLDTAKVIAAAIASVMLGKSISKTFVSHAMRGLA
jgi:hypothetical protein